MKHSVHRLAAAFAALVLLLSVVALSGCGKEQREHSAAEQKAFEEDVLSAGIFQNTWQDALPQTVIYRLIENHFNAPLPEGKTRKKALVIGYDGCRVDLFSRLNEEHPSAVSTLLKQGGIAVLSYAGGVNFPAENTQATSTNPGWCSMLTGVWADVHGITGNGVVKSNDHLTLLTTLVENGTIDASAFYVSWDGHFVRYNSVYILEKRYAKEKGLAVSFVDAKDDNGTKENVINDLARPDCSDFIFSTFEYTDHTGHKSGFTPDNPEYLAAFYEAEATGAELLNAVQMRETYAQEDWLILITTDHGGWMTKHGGPTLEERITFIASNQSEISGS